MRQPNSISCHYFADINFIEENKCVVLLMKKKILAIGKRNQKTRPKNTPRKILNTHEFTYIHTYTAYIVHLNIDIHQMYAFL